MTTRRLPVNAAHISPCESDETVFWEKQICFQNLLFQFFQHYNTSVAACSIGSAFL